MDRLPARPQLNDSFPSPPSCWARPPYRGHREASARGYPSYSPTSPMYSPGSNRGHWGGPQAGSGCRGRGFGGSPAVFGSGGRDFGERTQRRGNRFEWPRNFSPSASKDPSSDSVEKYFSPSMLEDPWAALQPKESQTSANNNQ
ncbi:M-phase-specific PLK1-interacting protein [Dunckerocampus dactyliophorus]|uniref:M-phase-specific PLK1-interacting protein n=1 Tax=Dunckerocampus dactyliophorus TaxID=161453 RepID=UPI00240672D8|nr:M-phase-specific PLK1-interacting protein [Dunckerocampus dactyliophorus]